MTLTCGCEEWYPEPGYWCYVSTDEGYQTLETSKRKRCCSCKELIDIGAICGIFPRYKVPGSDIEINIYGEDGEIPLASDYMCERCYDLMLSLEELGFCAYPRENQLDQVAEYAEYVKEERSFNETYSEYI